MILLYKYARFYYISLFTFRFSSDRFTQHDSRSGYQESTTAYSTTEGISSDKRRRELRAEENCLLPDDAMSLRRERINEDDVNDHRRSFNTNEPTETSGIVRRSTHNRQRTKLGADLFTAPLQRVEIESSQNRYSTSSSRRVTRASKTSERWMDNGLPPDDELNLKQGEANDQLLAGILAPPPEFSSQRRHSDSPDGSRNLAEPSRHNVGVQQQRLRVDCPQRAIRITLICIMIEKKHDCFCKRKKIEAHFRKF